MKTRLQEIRVLIIENSPVDSRMLRKMLDQSVYGTFQTKIVNSLKKAEGVLSKNNFDVILLDLNVEDSRGLSTLKRVHGKYPHIPIVVNTGAYQDNVGLETLRHGAQDYLVKGRYLTYTLNKALCYAIERKKIEEELNVAYANLKNMQAQLIHAEKMNMVGGLASGIAHEVKNPLATIIFGVDFLNFSLQSTDNDKIKLALRSIEKAAQKANDIIKDLLDFASVSKLKTEPENINVIIEHALGLVRHLCERNGIKITTKFKPCPNIVIDRNRIEQVLMDVMLNAIYAVKENGKIIIQTSSKIFSEKNFSQYPTNHLPFKAGDPIVIVDLTDTGTGIKKEDLPYIFDPFFTTRRASGGVGLGLFIAKAIMDNHQGYISITNKRSHPGARVRLMFKPHSI